MDDADKSAPFLDGYDVLRIPVVENGVPAWPEKFPVERIEQLRKSAGEAKFSSQMMLVPLDAARGRFDRNALRFYSGALECAERNRMLEFSICGQRIVGASCWWDPAYGSPDGDGSVIAAVFVDMDGRYYLHDVEYLRHSDSPEGEERSAAEQCARVAEFLRRNHVPALCVENNGLGRFLPEFLRAELARTGLGVAVVGCHSKMSKSLRILGAFDALLAAGYLNVCDSVGNTPWLSEFVEWSPSSNCRDDGLDAVAGALSAALVRMPSTTIRPARRVSRIAGKTFKIKSIFDI
jgi:phage terminase large subunit-like protein